MLVGNVSPEWRAEEIEKFILNAKTIDSKARIRMVEHRGVQSAAMLYDELAIIDIFRRIGEHRVLGVMDLKNPDPYFFVLERDDKLFMVEF